MREEEAFVGRALVRFLGGPEAVSVTDGADPPDLQLSIGCATVGVEVTRLTQLTFEPDGTLGNRTTYDISGTQLADRLDADAGLSIPDGISIMLSFAMPVTNLRRFRAQLADWIGRIASAAKSGYLEERVVEGAKVRLSVILRQPSGKRVVAVVANSRSSPDISLNARLALEARIREKDRICAGLGGPVWLALLNDYQLADADPYAEACSQLRLEHCFDRIFLVSREGQVSELEVTS